MRNVTFGYDGTGPVLKNINLEIKPGEWLGIMGPTGSSKTTLVNLIGRLYDPPSESLFLDGVDVRCYRLESLRRQVAYVPQQTYLFTDTVANNIRFGRNVPDSKIEELAEITRVYDDIMDLPDRFDVRVGERGITLSGGQKQRIAIARALAADPGILVLDDSFSAIDVSTEEQIMKSLKRYLTNQTVILISHRISSIHAMDRIVFLEEGRIVEEGSHEELIRKRGRYFALHEQQQWMDAMDIDADLPTRLPRGGST